MPYYTARYKLNADADNKRWFLGWHPDKDSALAEFNSRDAKDIGWFAFDEAGNSPTDYYLAEQESKRTLSICSIFANIPANYPISPTPSCRAAGGPGVPFPPRGSSLHRKADRAGDELCRPSCHRH